MSLAELKSQLETNLPKLIKFDAHLKYQIPILSKIIQQFLHICNRNIVIKQTLTTRIFI